MTLHQRLGEPASVLTPGELGDFLRAEPPAFLDALVKERVGSLLTRQRAELAERAEARSSPATHNSARSSLARSSSARSSSAINGSAMNRTEACAYALGFLAYGAQLADGVARMIWHAITG